MACDLFHLLASAIAPPRAASVQIAAWWLAPMSVACGSQRSGIWRIFRPFDRLGRRAILAMLGSRNFNAYAATFCHSFWFVAAPHECQTCCRLLRRNDG